ncbi:hypothetical protein PWT90_04484 [Aphanocladium album]|nr:hypothetical protein PWT90_04484 [Aphanocladium album]
MAQVQLSACHRAFALPELLQIIFEITIYSPANIDLKEKHRANLTHYLYNKRTYEGVFDAHDLRTLCICARVCRAWFAEAVPLLWTHRSDGFVYDTLEDILGPIAPARRQLYADHIWRASLDVYDGFAEPPPATTTANPAFAGLRFPKLVGVRIKVQWEGGRMPFLTAPNLAWAHLDPYYDGTMPSPLWGVHPEAWPGLFDQIAPNFTMTQIRSACERAFALPELVQAIIESIIYTPANRKLKHSLQGPQLIKYLGAQESCDWAFDADVTQLPTLAACARVCRLWFCETIPILWAHRGDLLPWDMMELVFEALPPPRRQLYADHLLCGHLRVEGAHHGAHQPPSTVMEELVFPRLARIRLEVGYHVCMLPPFAAPSLGWVQMRSEQDEWAGLLVGTPEIWPVLFEHLVDRFPALQSIEMLEYTPMFESTVTLLKEKYPAVSLGGIQPQRIPGE